MCVMYPVLAPSLLVLLVLRLCFGSVIGSSVTLFSFRCDGASRTVLQEPVVRPPRRSYPSVIRGPCPQRLFTVSRAKYSAGSAAHGGCHHSHARDTHAAAAVPAVVQAAWWDTTRLREVVGRVTRIERNWYQGRCRMSVRRSRRSLCLCDLRNKLVVCVCVCVRARAGGSCKCALSAVGYVRRLRAQ